MARKMARRERARYWTSFAVPKRRWISERVFCSSKRESTKRTMEPKVFGWSQLPGNGDGRGPSESRVSSTSRKRVDKEVISSEKRSLPDSRKPTWLAKLSISARSWEERKTVDS